MTGSQSPDRSPPSRCEEDSDSTSCTMSGSEQDLDQYYAVDWTELEKTGWAAPQSVARGTPETRQQAPSDTSVPRQLGADTNERTEPSNSRQMSVDNLLNASHSSVGDQKSPEQPQQAGMAPTNIARQSMRDALAGYQTSLMLKEQERVRMLMKRRETAREEQESVSGVAGDVNDAHPDRNAVQTRSEGLQSNKRPKTTHIRPITAGPSSTKALPRVLPRVSLPRVSLSRTSVGEGMVANQNVDKPSATSRQNEQENVQWAGNLGAKMLPSKPEDWFISCSSMESFIRPGEVLVSTGFDNLETYLATSRARPVQEGPCKWRWAVEAWTYRFDGSGGLRREEKTLYLEYRPKTAGEKICFGSLGFAPLRLFGEAFHQHLREQGRLIWQCRKRRLVSCVDEYDGVSLSKEGRFMIDFKAYNDTHPNSDTLNRSKSHLASKLTGVDFWRDEPPAEPDLLLLPHQLVGFDFSTNTWRHLQAKNIRLDVGWNDRAFASLIADTDTKEAIEMLALAQSSVHYTADMPGNSLLMLFRGGPGTGKTYMAEATAEMMRKPLYRVTCGDIGTEPDQFKNHLNSVFKLATLWGCIVLFEDADVFLAQCTCTADDRHRNDLSSVFTHTLDRHGGIVILTSTRSATFDGALMSRVRLRVNHGPLDKLQRKELWREIFAQESKVHSGFNIDKLMPHLDFLSEFEMDGRQIRNSVKTARQVSTSYMHKRKTVNLEHVMQAIRATIGAYGPL